MNTSSSLYKTITIKKITENIKDFKTFSFNDDHHIQYKAGQYLTFVRYQHDKEIRRSYSITSSPVLNEALSIGVKRIENGFFSRLLVDSAGAGDELITIGAGGLFVLPDNISDYKQVFFFAAGSGITPVYSLVKTLLHAHKHIHVVLIYSNASPAKTIFLNELKILQQEYPQQLHVEFLFSNIVQLAKARLHRGLLAQFLNQFSKCVYSEALFYICGPESYMRLCTYTLQEHDVPKANIKREDFVINAAPRRDALPPDTVPHKAFIKLAEAGYSFDVDYPDSVLKAAKKAGIVLPYSCEAGRCGSCVAKCVRGKIWHSYNEVLTEKELQQGMVLTCVGHPVNGDVVLEIKMM